MRVGDFELGDDEEPVFRSLKFCLFKTAVDFISNWSIKFMCWRILAWSVALASGHVGNLNNFDDEGEPVIFVIDEGDDDDEVPGAVSLGLFVELVDDDEPPNFRDNMPSLTANSNCFINSRSVNCSIRS